MQWITLDLIRGSMVVGFIVFLLLPYVWNKIFGVKSQSLTPKSYNYDEGKMLCRHDWLIQYWMTVTYAEAPKGTVIIWGSQEGPHIPWTLQLIAGPGMIPVRFSGSQSGTIRWPSLAHKWLQCNASLHHKQSQGCQKKPPKDTRGVSTSNHYREGVRSEIRQNCSVNNCIHFLSFYGLASLSWFDL